MRSVIIALMILVNSNIFAAKIPGATVHENNKPVSVSFFIDDHNERFGLNKDNGIAKEFARALSKKASLVTIVSNYILKNMILRKYTKNPDKFLNSLDIDINDWDIYHVNNTQFFVFLPINYDSPILNKTLWTKIDFSQGDEYNGAGSADFPTISWADDIPTEVKKLLFHESMRYISYAQDANTAIKDLSSQEKAAHKKFDPAQLSLIFKPIEDYERVSLSQPCNIFVNGHGGYSPEVKFLWIPILSENISVVGMSVEDLVNMLLFFNDKLNTKSVRLLSCYIGGNFLDLIQVKNSVPIRIKYLLIVDSITDAPSYDIFPSQLAVFTGINLKNYFEVLDVFQDSSESFQERVKEIKSTIGEPIETIKLKIKNLERESGFSRLLKELSLPRNWYLIPGIFNNFPQILIPRVGWFQAFNTAASVQRITNASIINALARPEILEEEEIEIKDSRKNPSLVKKAIIKNRLKKIDFTEIGTIEINKKLALLIYSEIIFVSLNIIPNPGLRSEVLYAGESRRWLLNLYKYFPSIPCFDIIYSANPVKKNFYIYPQFVSMQRGDSLNLCSKINIVNAGEPTIQTGILNFLRDSFLILWNRRSEKTFFIKELEGFNDFSEILDDKDNFKKYLKNKKQEKKQIILENVFVKTSVKNRLTAVSISFNFNDKEWALKYSSKDLNLVWGILPVDKSQSLWSFEEASSSHRKNLKSLNLTYLAELSPQEYYRQLPAIRDIFHNIKTNINIKDPSANLSFKEFIAGLDPAVIKEAMRKYPDVTANEWANFEQAKNQSKLHKNLRAQTQLELKLEHQFRLQLNLKKIKTELSKLKQKLSILSSKLQFLKKSLASIV